MLWPGTRSPWIQILPPYWVVTQVRWPNGRLVSSDPGPPFLLPVASFNMKPVRTRGGFRCRFSRWSSSGAGGIRLLQLRAATPNFRQMGSDLDWPQLPTFCHSGVGGAQRPCFFIIQHQNSIGGTNLRRIRLKLEICCWLTMPPVPDHVLILELLTMCWSSMLLAPDHVFSLLQLDYWSAS
jgi:hypothetical protein